MASGLFGNNTYTGATVINGGFNAVTGTNASTFVEVVGQPGAGNLSTLSLQGANGSYLSATTILAASGGTLTLDNNASLGGAGSINPTIPAAQNNNRLADNVEIQLRDGGLYLPRSRQYGGDGDNRQDKYSRRAPYHHSRDERNWHGRGYGCGRFHDGAATVDGCV